MSDEPIVAPDRQFKVTKEGMPEQRFHTWMEDITTRLNEGQNLPTLEGIGTPEAAVEAIKDRRYRDTATNDFYLKTTATGDTGWLII